jgi:type IV pilus assembly protein PilE
LNKLKEYYHVPYKRNAGFTLIEAMIALVILGILAAIAWPAYESQGERSRRTDAVKALSIAVTELERCQSDTGTYTGCGFTATSPDGYYDITINRTADTFTLTATPDANQIQANDTDCTTFTLNHLGERDYTGDATNIKRCWTQ